MIVSDPTSNGVARMYLGSITNELAGTQQFNDGFTTSSIFLGDLSVSDDMYLSGSKIVYGIPNTTIYFGVTTSINNLEFNIDAFSVTLMEINYTD
jgi:hypothetical protein